MSPGSTFLKTCLLSSVLATGALRHGEAALLYYADFENYLPGQSVVTNNSTGASNTFSFLTAGASLTVGGAEDPFSSNHATMSADSIASSSVALRRSGMNFGSGDVRVLSFDLANSTGSTFSFVGNFLGTGNTSITGGWGNGSASLSISASDTSLYRVSLVYNNSGGTIALPGELGSLNSGGCAFYYTTDGITFTLVGFNAAALSANGVAFSLNWSAASNGESQMIDNMGFWSSAEDTVNGTSVLALAPGSPVPEPAAVGLAALATAILAGVRAKRRQIGSDL